MLRSAPAAVLRARGRRRLTPLLSLFAVCSVLPFPSHPSRYLVLWKELRHGVSRSTPGRFGSVAGCLRSVVLISPEAFGLEARGVLSGSLLLFLIVLFEDCPSSWSGVKRPPFTAAWGLAVGQKSDSRSGKAV
ncbi:hypothetical protein HID58_006941 [Brassica napus]|uniref:Secreted protein n=1 Tax=Brassica napus TaxID=3708 RepID=A0ABQ8ECY9_BRANA|nr:hypothetical protein HID58_006941 [Brassica napus]